MVTKGGVREALSTCPECGLRLKSDGDIESHIRAVHRTELERRLEDLRSHPLWAGLHPEDRAAVELEVERMILEEGS